MLRFRRPPLSFVIFLLVLVGIGAVVGHFVNAAGLAAFLFFVNSIEAKPAWNFWWGKPGNQYNGRGWAFNSYQRIGATSPKEIRNLPQLESFQRRVGKTPPPKFR
jgi:hypothetical protein